MSERQRDAVIGNDRFPFETRAAVVASVLAYLEMESSVNRSVSYDSTGFEKLIQSIVCHRTALLDGN